MTATKKLAARNALRRPVRTALTAGMVVLAVALLLLSMTWIGGAMGSALAASTSMAGHARVVTPGFVEREELMPLEENLEEVEPLVELVRRQPGVTGVEPRITTGVLVTAGDEIGDVHAGAVGAQESFFREQLGLKEKLVSGAWFSGAPDEIVAGVKVVELTGAKIGDELLLLGMTQDGSMSPITGRLVGIVRTGGQPADRQVLLPLERLQWMTDIPDGATELLVFGADYQKAGELAAQLRALPGLAQLSVQSWDEREPWKSLAATTQSMQAIIISVIVLLAALGIWNTMMMSVLERTHEIGVLRALGLSRLGAVSLFVGEALAIGVLGGLVGVGLGAIPSYLLAKHGLHIGEQTASTVSIGMSETIYGEMKFEYVVAAFGLGLLMAVLGSVLPAIRSASIQPVTAMRSGR